MTDDREDHEDHEPCVERGDDECFLPRSFYNLVDWRKNRDEHGCHDDYHGASHRACAEHCDEDCGLSDALNDVEELRDRLVFAVTFGCHPNALTREALGIYDKDALTRIRQYGAISFLASRLAWLESSQMGPWLDRGEQNTAVAEAPAFAPAAQHSPDKAE